jgi:hypothetical protein
MYLVPRFLLLSRGFNSFLLYLFSIRAYARGACRAPEQAKIKSGGKRRI